MPEPSLHRIDKAASHCPWAPLPRLACTQQRRVRKEYALYLAWLSVATQELSAMPERATFSFDSVDLPRSVVYSLPRLALHSAIFRLDMPLECTVWPWPVCYRASVQPTLPCCPQATRRGRAPLPGSRQKGMCLGGFRADPITSKSLMRMEPTRSLRLTWLLFISWFK